MQKFTCLDYADLHNYRVYVYGPVYIRSTFAVIESRLFSCTIIIIITDRLYSIRFSPTYKVVHVVQRTPPQHIHMDALGLDGSILEPTEPNANNSSRHYYRWAFTKQFAVDVIAL